MSFRVVDIWMDLALFCVLHSADRQHTVVNMCTPLNSCATCTVGCAPAELASVSILCHAYVWPSQVVLKTTHGDIDVELWAKEAPKVGILLVL